MSFRKERKIKLLKGEQKLLEINLKKKGMKKIHAPRKISSCYFDSNNLTCFYESEEGILPRRKIRIRWYNNNPNLFKEEKISSIEGRFKISDNFYDEKFLKDFKKEIFSKSYGFLTPSLIVNYIREYYIYQGVRLTFDSKINYINLRNKTKKNAYDSEAVVEIKSKFEVSEDFLDNLIPNRISRFSKYCRGVILTRLI